MGVPVHDSDDESNSDRIPNHHGVDHMPPGGRAQGGSNLERLDAPREGNPVQKEHICNSGNEEDFHPIPAPREAGPEERIDFTVDGTEINDTQRSRLLNVLQSFDDVFSRSDNDLGRTKEAYHEIDVGNSRPIKQA